MKTWVRVPAWVDNDPYLRKVFCMGFLSGFGRRNKIKDEIEIKKIKKLRLKRGKANISKKRGYIPCSARSLNIYSLAREKLEDKK